MRIEKFEIASIPPFPNNPLPLLLYKGAATGTQINPEWFEEKFRTNGWTGTWRNGIYSFHHFHAEAHEVLGCYSGSATVLFGGPGGIEAGIEAGDAVLIPAGVGHCLKDSSDDFRVVGAYPVGTYPDLRKDAAEGFEVLLELVGAVPLPEFDPVGGAEAGIRSFWGDGTIE